MHLTGNRRYKSLRLKTEKRISGINPLQMCLLCAFADWVKAYAKGLRIVSYARYLACGMINHVNSWQVILLSIGWETFFKFIDSVQLILYKCLGTTFSMKKGGR